jgi:hypothetical protein
MFRVLCAGLFAAAVALAGCDTKKPTSEFKGKHDHDHGDHNRKDAMLEDITLPEGTKCHAGLTAHLSEKEGNELDVFFESFDKEPKPVAIPLTAKVTARVTRKGDNEPKTLTFEPADKDERKADPADKCSRFAAKAAWMKPDDTLDVTLSVEYGGQLKKVTFSPFVPKDRTHAHKD